jgi:HD-GYP domain-containing protein (c-di-GMP phosphodiesterase class II)
MSDTRELLSKIADLRQRLDRTRGQAVPALAAGPETPDASQRIGQLAQVVQTASTACSLLDGSLGQMADLRGQAAEQPVWPRHLTLRGRQVLERGRELIGELRGLTEEPLLCRGEDDPLDAHFRETTAMTEAALRMVQVFPDAPSAQLRLCAGIEAILDVVARRLASLRSWLERRRREAAWVDQLTGWLADLAADRPPEMKWFLRLGEELLDGPQRGAPLRFLHAGPDEPARFIACHSLTVAQVAARVVAHDPELRGRRLDVVVAALVHDVGMLRVPADVLAQRDPLTDERRRAIEGHARAGAELAARLWPAAGWLADAALGHHERLDGTGYPQGLRASQLTPLNRFLAVCDVYAALASPRPHRPAGDPRTALTDTLLLAEQGALDRHHAERLLTLSFYPIGSVVELADGAVGLVVATHPDRRDLTSPARPVLALLTDPEGQPLPAPQPLDLAQVEGRSIVRSLPADERRRLLGRSYPEAA